MQNQQKTTIVLATTNKGKVNELAEPMTAYGLKVIGLDAFPTLEEIAETENTFEGNALLKAKTVAEFTGLIAIADDSGLEVEALNGAPGIYSARYASDYATLEGESKDARNIRKLLSVMKNIPVQDRKIKFISAMAACTPQGKYIITRGEWQGILLTEPKGQNGFGYDPVFFDPKLNKTAAELTKESKTAVSHRGHALKQLLEKWPTFWAEFGGK